MGLTERLGLGKRAESRKPEIIIAQLNDVGCTYPFHSSQLYKIDAVEKGEVPFENLSPTGTLVYILKQLKDKNLIDPERTEMPIIMSMWGARCGVKSAEDLEVHIVCQDLSGRKTTLSAAFSYDQGEGIEICECAFPQTRQAADDIVGRIEMSIKSYRNEL